MPVRAVFFDLDDTLVSTSAHDRSAFRACVQLIGLRRPGSDGEALVAAYRRQLSKAPWDPEDRVPISDWRAQLWVAALDEIGQATAAAVEPPSLVASTSSRCASPAELGAELQHRFDEVRLGEFAWVEGVLELVERLGAAGLRMCVITNGHSDVQHPKLKVLRASDLFEHIIVGGDEVRAGRLEKPDAGIFLKACELTGVAPMEAIHIGDSLSSDIAGAIAAGLRASIWVSLGSGLVSENCPRPDFTVTSITELPVVLVELGCLEGPSLS